ncbi:SMI1/KNR4 family protein [Bacillus sp. AFS031507]|uniref:SMI1/KNR4 family protein n=1 Tax=Bacillus sp. AFS031507 TaxID=2033496 RepID=UPI000BFC57C2|nr:SMI1/KNR4 family protein [Bacillus sp. AFS031507]PGY06819.1 SMI1/KNR4 family protein [Bacillus sp. AFS031507]
MWKTLMKSVSEDSIFNEPAINNQIEEIEAKFNLNLPREFISFLKETNGAEVKGAGFSSIKFIIELNSDFRRDKVFKETYMPLDCLLFIGGSGNGDYFGYSIVDGDIQSENIYYWNHETDSREWIAPSLEQLFIWWSEGKVSV